MDFSSNDVIVERQDGLGVITLNRPQALNAMSHEMIRQIAAALRRWEKDEAVRCVLFRGAGGRAFCAGGDIKVFHRAGMDYRRGDVDARVPAVFFGEEYSLNRQIFHYPKPTIAWMNGITMGGGFGLAGNCRYRIATSHTVFAMPEVGIGFFPDVGSVYHLLRVPGNAGKYLALTGASISAGDVMFAGLAHGFADAGREEELIEALQGGDVEKVLPRFYMAAPEGGDLKEHAEKIEKIFSHARVNDVLDALKKDGSGWAQAVLDLIKRRSPSSVMVTAAHLMRSQGKSFDEIIRTDFTLAQRFLERMDLYEGIRATLIDKDKNPGWEPAGFAEITEAQVEAYFTPTGYNLDDVQIFDA